MVISYSTKGGIFKGRGVITESFLHSFVEYYISIAPKRLYSTKGKPQYRTVHAMFTF